MKHMLDRESLNFVDVSKTMAREDLIFHVSNDHLEICLREATMKYHNKMEILEYVAELEANMICTSRGQFKLEELEVKKDRLKPSIEEPPTF